MGSDDIGSLRDTIIPKSDQLNADDLLAGTITVTITGVRRGSAEQPVDVMIAGRQPYKPCKSMRRALITAWGDDARVWVGRCMTLYADPEVKFGGVKVGGIRISHLSHIERDLNLSLTATKGKRVPHTIERMPGYVAAAQGSKALQDWWKKVPPAQKADLKPILDAVWKAEALAADGPADALAQPATDLAGDRPATYAEIIERIRRAASAEAVTAAEKAAEHLPPTQREEISILAEEARAAFAEA